MYSLVMRDREAALPFVDPSEKHCTRKFTWSGRGLGTALYRQPGAEDFELHSSPIPLPLVG